VLADLYSCAAHYTPAAAAIPIADATVQHASPAKTLSSTAAEEPQLDGAIYERDGRLLAQ
jgi:hypothetical protein